MCGESEECVVALTLISEIRKVSDPTSVTQEN